LTLPAICLEQLRKHRQLQLQERLKAGGDWCDTGLVFTTYTRRGPGERVGAPLHPRNVLRTLHRILTRAQLPRRRFHDLRHSAASLLIASGVELVEVSMLLGHSEPARHGRSVHSLAAADGLDGRAPHGNGPPRLEGQIVGQPEKRYLNITDVGVVRSMRELWGRRRAAGRAQG
jgi:integrase